MMIQNSDLTKENKMLIKTFAKVLNVLKLTSFTTELMLKLYSYKQISQNALIMSTLSNCISLVSRKYIIKKQLCIIITEF